MATGLHRAGTGLHAVASEAAVLLPFLLGVLTSLNSVPIPLGVAHQLRAVLLLPAAIVAGHRSLTRPIPSVTSTS